jgi:hypothetical protein
MTGIQINIPIGSLLVLPDGSLKNGSPDKHHRCTICNLLVQGSPGNGCPKVAPSQLLKLMVFNCIVVDTCRNFCNIVDYQIGLYRIECPGRGGSSQTTARYLQGYPLGGPQDL